MNNGTPIIPNGEPQVVAQIVITQLSDGQTHVHGPINNKIVAYGLLEVAKEIIQNHKPDQSQILPARFKVT